ncbi:hypothetical protein GH714_014554 [Hevea brasiliensis]|uniref:RNase H type-1 domain-containing protein n=1 Tax=Hevea brasiliensis TaxID=3981 RepID=A0A6A6LHZ6_HEVBR|nr:hypothetical protein GH714_014554 [Hevea brasiliensis]
MGTPFSKMVTALSWLVWWLPAAEKWRRSSCDLLLGLHIVAGRVCKAAGDIPITNITMTNNHSLCSILDANKLTKPNFLDWYRNLRIVLKQEKRLYVLERAKPNIPLVDALEEYSPRVPGIPPVLPRSRGSHIWRAVVDSWPFVHNKVHLLIRSGDVVRFWDEKWIPVVSNLDDLWKLIWSWSGPERVRVFLSLAFQNKILSNSQRFIRGLSQDASCPFCGHDSEDAIHVLRDCVVAKFTWMGAMDQTKRYEFFIGSIHDWVSSNFRVHFERHCSDSQLVFGVACWWIWKWRNAYIFSNMDPPSNPVQFIVVKVQEVKVVITGSSTTLITERQESFISWTPLGNGWVKVNTDDSVIRNSGAAGGLIQDSHGKWITGFVRNIGHCAWELGFRQIIVEIDNRAACQVLQGSSEVLSVHGPLIHSIHSFKSRNWKLCFVHAYREANFCADKLSHLAHGFPLGFTRLDQPLVVLFQLLQGDVLGVAHPMITSCLLVFFFSPFLSQKKLSLHFK